MCSSDLTEGVTDERGAIPCLFTDLANPTSNGVYQRIGYEPVDDTVHLRIADTPA